MAMSHARYPLFLLVWVALLAVAAVPSWPADASQEWPQWRGPNRDGHSPDKNLLSEWDKDGPQLAWKTPGMGKGFSSAAVADGKVFTMGERGDGQFVIALSAADGKPLWSTKFAPKGGNDPRGTPTVDGDRVYVVGGNGVLGALDAESGKIVWSKDFKKDFGAPTPGWGFCESPLVDGDRLICTPGAKEAMMVALDKKSGEVIWKSAYTEKGKRGGGGAGYSSIVISNGGGVKQYVQLIGHGLIGVRAKDGKLLWNYDGVANGTANIPTPIISGDYVFGSSGYGTGSALLKLVGTGDDEVKAEEVYFLEADKLQNHHGGLILVGEHIYGGHGHNNGFPICVEMKTGKTAWSQGRGPGTGSAAVAYADGHIYFRYENGVVALVEATPKGYKLKGTFKIPNVRDPSWPHPTIVGGKLYLREQDTMYCYDVAS
jgi:outer membrane protein assembly factor BamB